MAELDNRTLFRRYFDEALNQGHLEVIDEVFATNYVHHDPTAPGPLSGPDAVKDHVATLRHAFPNLHFTIENEIADGDDIVVRWSAHLTHTGDYFGIPPTGKESQITGMNHWHTLGGQAVEGWVSRDDLGLLRQLGVINLG